MTARLFVRSRTGQRVGQLTDFTQLDMIIRDRNVSSWSINCARSDMADALSEPGAGVIIDVDGQTRLTGLRVEEDVSWDASSDRIILSGVSDDVHLWDTNIYPANPVPFPDDTKRFSSRYSDDVTGPAETVMHYYVNRHLLDFTRAIPGGPSFTLAPNLGRGAVLKRSERLSVLGEALSSIAAQSASIGGARLSFGITNNQFYVSETRDRRKEAVFSVASGNLARYQFKNTSPSATHVLIAAQGEGTDRVIVLEGDNAAAAKWGRRIEVFKDMRGTAEIAELFNAASEELSSKAEKSEVSLRPIDVPHREFGKDWNLGDLVTVQGIESTVSEVRITLNADGQTVIPSTSSLSTAAALSALKAFDAIRDARRRTNALERNY